MILENLTLVNFKNYEQKEFNFHTHLNCLLGSNGIGKTNILDAIHYLSLTKSYFNAIDSQNINHNKDFFIIQGTFKHEDEHENIYCAVKRNQKKQFTRNKKEYQRFSEHIGLIPVVMISPEDINLLLEGSEIRRKFMNGVISQYNKNYLNDHIKYNKLLNDRNKILKQNDFNKIDPAHIEVMNEQLDFLGHKIYDERLKFIEEFTPVFHSIYNKLSNNQERVKLIYTSHLHDHRLIDLLKSNYEKDTILGYTSKGIHKDDIHFMLEDYPLKKTGSQGQQKTYLVSLKLAKFSFLRKTNQKTPLLLLDDIFDKFDQNRVEKLIDYVSSDHFHQVFITDTNPHRLKNILSERNHEFNVYNFDQENAS